MKKNGCIVFKRKGNGVFEEYTLKNLCLFYFRKTKQFKRGEIRYDIC